MQIKNDLSNAPISRHFPSEMLYFPMYEQFFYHQKSSLIKRNFLQNFGSSWSIGSYFLIICRKMGIIMKLRALYLLFTILFFFCRFSVQKKIVDILNFHRILLLPLSRPNLKSRNFA